MKECRGEYIYLNGKQVSASSFQKEYLASGITIYEVLRIIEGKPLFLADHLERFKNSLKK